MKSLGLGAAVVLLCLVAAATGTTTSWQPPAFDAVVADYRPSDVHVVDRRGEVLHEIRVDPQRRRLAWAPLDEVSPALVRAVIAAEDQRFHLHGGVDWRALAAAAWQTFGGGRRGGSTISMQVAALIDPRLTRGRRGEWRRKLEQIGAARNLERRWHKREILEAYLNLVSLRGEVQGVGAGAHVLFGKRPHGLTQPEAVVLAALLPAPNATPDRLRARALRLWRRIAVEAPDTRGLDDAVARAVAQSSPQAPRRRLAPHLARRLPRAGDSGAAIATTLDAATQRIAIEAVQRQLLALDHSRVRDAAVLVADHRSGEVLAYVGGSGERSSAAHVDGVRARRQAGSTLKPFLYATAIEQRILTAASKLSDTPIEIAAANGSYRPENYDERFRGWVSVRDALASSLNVPAVRAVELIGADALVDRLRSAGVIGLDQPGSYYGPALALGSADVTLWELVAAYASLAQGGIYQPLRLQPGMPTEPGRRVFSPPAAFVIADILADRDARGFSFGLESALATPFWTAVKTGTSKDMRDNWCIGFSQQFVVGVWVGNFSGQPMGDVSGVSGAAPIWLDVIRGLHEQRGSRAPLPPHGVIAVDTPAGREWFLTGTEPARAGDAPAMAVPRIVEPAPRARFALDPDIPLAQQRIAFRAQAQDAGWYWRLDGRRIDAQQTVHLWQPHPGSHELLMMAADDRVLDRVRFEVAGATAVTTD